MMIIQKAVLGIAVASLVASPAMAASDPSGIYTRPNGDTVKVWIAEDRLYCRIIEGKKKDFEMCHGMVVDKKTDSWKGKKMKHPGMPGFMTFSGTVTSDATSLKIKGCALICDTEVWKKVP